MHTQTRQYSKAFTIVELTIVILVIGILAAVAVVGYGSWRSRTAANVLKVDLTSAVSQLKSDLQWSNALPATSENANGGKGLPQSQGTTYQYQRISETTYCLTATSNRKGTPAFMVTSDNTTPREGTCPGHTPDGQPPIVNLAINPRAVRFENAPGNWWNNRWTADGTYSLITGATGHPAGITTAARFTVATARNGHGFHLAGNTEAGPVAAQLIPVTPGQVLTVSAYMRKSSNPSVQISIIGRFATSAPAWVGSSIAGSPVATQAGQWVRASATLTAPANARWLALNFQAATSDTVGTVWDGTGLMITEGPILHPYADGASPGWIWNGTAHNATSSGPPL